MKKLIYWLSGLSFVCFLIYLIPATAHSFAVMSFEGYNLAEWHPGFRFILAMIWISVTAVWLRDYKKITQDVK